MGIRPHIGVTSPCKGGYGSWIFTKFILMLYGAKAVKITTKKNIKLNTFKGFVIAGGADVDPTLYGQILGKEWKDERIKNRRAIKKWLFLPLILLIRFFSSSTSSFKPDKARDDLELSIIDYAFKKNLPLLGICRGMQLMNIYHGGSLHSDIKNFYIEYPHLTTLLPKKNIDISKDSLLFQILGHDRYLVNSLHHQSINSLGEGLRAVALEENGIIQAIEAPAHPFFIGLQWHPEYLLQFRPQRLIFYHLVQASKL